MRINTGITDYAVGRLSILMGREGNVCRRAEAEVTESAAAAGLFTDVDLHWIYVNVSVNRTGPDNKPLPTCCERTRSWRHSVKNREYIANCDIDLSPWGQRVRRKQGLPPLPPADEMVTFMRRCLATVIAQVAAALDEPEQAIARFVRQEGVAPVIDVQARADSAEPQEALAQKEPYATTLGISFPEGGFTTEAGFARRKAIRELVEAVLERYRLGRFDSASSSGGSYELAMFVSDGSRAVDIIRQALADAGHEVSDFIFETEG